ncbi:MAG: undecaprenyl-phosphate glucose phosphotransferase [Cyclobacteriaceae bacterium]|nr:undecaprenyl-phosphate glucose phosphotransferase [Cyclobacteriaceae bacterium HetDA_MAG_MS6]
MSRRRLSPYFPLFFIFFDLLSLNLGFGFANFIRFGTFLYYHDNYNTLQILLNVLWLLVFFSSKLDEINREQRLLDHLNKILTALVINLAIVFALWFATKPFYYSREHLFYTYLFFSVLLLSWRTFWHFLIRYYRAKGFNLRNVVIVGHGDLANELLYFIRVNRELGYRYLGFFDSDRQGALGKISEVDTYVDQNPVDVIFCCLPQLSDDEIKEVIDYADSNLIKVKIISQFSRLANRNLAIQNYGPIPVLNVNAIPLDSKINQSIKRGFDIIFSGLVLFFVLSWLIPVIGLLIKLESKGPIFFKQFRHGKDNRKFLCWKFRTMVVNQDADLKQATKHDSRITKIGAILRKTSIDELPQFINVFLGDMSVVGPRPHPIKLNEKFQPSIEKFWQRHAVKPGITGLAQAKGFRGETSEFSAMSGRVRLDRFYVRNWSLLLDFKIILLTVISIVRGSENAY